MFREMFAAVAVRVAAWVVVALLFDAAVAARPFPATGTERPIAAAVAVRSLPNSVENSSSAATSKESPWVALATTSA